MKPAMRPVMGARLAALLAVFAALAVIGRAEMAVAVSDLPATITIKGLENKYGPVTFNHEKHIGMAGACGKCHHLHNDNTVATCRTCHALKVDDFRSTATHAFLRCEGCHKDASVDKPGMPGLKVAFHKICFSCHVGIGELGASPKGCQSTCHSRK